MDAILDPGTDRRSLRNAPALGVALCSLLLLLPLAAFRPFGARSGHVLAMAESTPPMAMAMDMAPEMAQLQALGPELEHLRAMRPALEGKLAEAFAGVQAAQAARESAAAALEAARASLATVASATPVAAFAPGAPAAPTRAYSFSSGTAGSCSSVSLRRSGSSTSIHTSSDDDD